MAILYLTEQQAWVGREGECLVIHLPEPKADKDSGVAPDKTGSKRTRKKEIPLTKIEGVMVLGDITLTTQALFTLLEARVSVAYLSRNGRYLGSLHPALSKNSLLRLAQHAAHADLERRHALARHFVLGKLRNMRTLLMRYNRTNPDPIIFSQIESLKRCIASAQTVRLKLPVAALSSQPSTADSLNLPTDSEGTKTTQSETESGETESEEEVEPSTELEVGEVAVGRMSGLGPLLGCEGAGSAAYFGCFGRLVKCDWPHGFTRRTRRPPTDPVNALLSYGYTILAAQVASAIASVGFDPYIGYLHSSRYGKPALALDLLEEFRPIIVDSVVLSLFNNRQLEAKDFQKELNTFRMTDATRRLFLQKFEERMQEVIVHPFFEYRTSYRQCLELQARLLGKYMMGEVSEYVSFVVR